MPIHELFQLSGGNQKIGAVDTNSKSELCSLMFNCVGQGLLIHQVYGSRATAQAPPPRSELEAGETSNRNELSLAV